MDQFIVSADTDVSFRQMLESSIGLLEQQQLKAKILPPLADELSVIASIVALLCDLTEQEEQGKE